MEVERVFLVLLGKIQIAKTFIIIKFLSKAALISISKDLIKEINKLIYQFAFGKVTG